MIETRAPGKLFIVGEYAVVEAGEPAVLVAVNRYLHVRLFEREAPNAMKDAAAESDHVRAAIRVVDELRTARGLPERFFDIEITSELDGPDGRKYGLGSSAAVTVATVDALCTLYDLTLDVFERFKLALLATIEVSPRASGGDLAASTYGGWIGYVSPDRERLISDRNADGVAAAMLSDGWQGCNVTPLPAPESLTLLVGWTGSPASTEHLVTRVTESTSARPGGNTRAAFLERSRTNVHAFISAMLPGTQSDAAALGAISEARALLRQLGEDRGIVIETPALRELNDIAEKRGAAAKSSGAGGGDCGIALAPPDCDIAGILREWEDHEITPLNLTVYESSYLGKGDAHER